MRICPPRGSFRLAAHLAPFLAGASLLLSGASATAQTINLRNPVDIVPPRFLDAPILVPNPNPAVPLAARITLRTDEPSTVELAFKDGQRSWSVLAAPELATQHVVPVLGVRPNRTHLIRVIARDAAGNARYWHTPLQWVTPPVPADFFPPVLLKVREPGLMEPGVTLFSATSSRYDDAYLMMVDDEGQVVWFYRTPDFVGDTRRLSNGSVVPSLFTAGDPQHLDERLRGLLYVLAQHPTFLLR